MCGAGFVVSSTKWKVSNRILILAISLQMTRRSLGASRTESRTELARPMTLPDI